MTAPDYDPAEDLTILANNYTLNPSRVERIRAHIAALRADRDRLAAENAAQAKRIEELEAERSDNDLFYIVAGEDGSTATLCPKCGKRDSVGS